MRIYAFASLSNWSVLFLVSSIKILPRKILFKFSAVEKTWFVCMQFSIEILSLYVELRDSSL